MVSSGTEQYSAISANSYEEKQNNNPDDESTIINSDNISSSSINNNINNNNNNNNNQNQNNKKNNKNDDDDDGGEKAIEESNRSQSGPPSFSLSFDNDQMKNEIDLSREKLGYNSSDYCEKNYEGLGYGRSGDAADLVVLVDDAEIESPNNEENNSAPSPNGNAFRKVNTASPSSILGRQTWLRTSLRRTSPGNSSRPARQLGSNALASQLYRSGSFNSSSRGSTAGDATDDMYSDVSLEDDVIDLNHRVKMIQEQMDALVDTQSIGGERYARVKQENATLQARILMLEEAAKDAEVRAEERMKAEQLKHKEKLSRLEREKQLQFENYAIKIQTHELECSSLKEQIARLREQLDLLKVDRARLETALEEANNRVSLAKEAEKQATLQANEMRIHLDTAKEELKNRDKDRQRIEELLLEVARLDAKNKTLQESQDELQATIAIYTGRELLMLNQPKIRNDENPPSLAAELSAQENQDQDDTDSSIFNKKLCSTPEIMNALKEQQEVNTKLRSYIDGILLNIVENYPQLLEVKQPQ